MTWFKHVSPAERYEQGFDWFYPFWLRVRKELRDMYEIRFHGRGGQGAVTSAEVLAVGAIASGHYAQAFPSFGPERRGAPVIAFARVSEEPIRERTKVQFPSAVVVLDPSLLSIVKVGEGLRDGGIVIVNSAKSKKELAESIGVDESKIATVDATHIAREEIGRPITNTTMLGALIKVTGIVDKKHMEEALRHRFGRIADRNIKAFNRAREEVKPPEAG